MWYEKEKDKRERKTIKIPSKFCQINKKLYLCRGKRNFNYIVMKNALYLLLIFFTTSCTIQNSYQIAPTRVYAKSSIAKYSYAHILPTNTITTGNMKVSTSHFPTSIGWMNHVEGNGLTESVSPSDVIAGFLMRKGYAIVSKLDSAHTKKTLEISYGDCGCKHMHSSYYKTVIIQFRDSHTNELIASIESEAMGKSEASATENAIETALKILFKKAEPWFQNN